MSIPIPLRRDFSALQLRGLAKKTKDGPQARRLLTLAAIYDGATRTEAAKIGGVGLQIIRDWVLRFATCACAAPACAECRARSRDGADGFLRARQWPGCRGPTSGSAQSRRPKPRPMGPAAVGHAALSSARAAADHPQSGSRLPVALLKPDLAAAMAASWVCR
jgi:hypothetical protein